MVLLPNRLLDNIVVSSEYHIQRVKEIYEKILGDKFLIDCVGVPIALVNAQETSENERKGLEIFRTQFGQVRDGDSETIETVLYSVHNLYKDLSQESRWRKGISPVKRIGEYNNSISKPHNI